MLSSRRGWWPAALASALLVGSVRAPLLADDKPAAVVDEASFSASIEQARRLLQAGRAREGLKVVDEALTLHQRKDYVRAKRADLEDLVHRLSFCAACPPPDPKTMVKGELKKFISKSGEFEIKYQAGKPTDFETRGDSLLFPSRFRGAYAIVVKGDSYPARPDAAPMIQVGYEENPKTRKVQAWGLSFGVPPFVEGNRKIWLPARILYLDGEVKKTLSEIATSPAQPGRPYRIDVQVTSGRVTGSIDGNSIGSASKPDGVWGYALLRVPAWREITVSGLVEPSWIQSKVDAIVDAKRKDFDAKFHVENHLPGWLYENAPTPGPAAAPRVSSGLAIPASLPPELVGGFTEALARVMVGDGPGAVKAVSALRAKGASDAVTCLLMAKALVLSGEPSKALVEADKAVAADPDAVDALLVKGQILLRLGREADFVATMTSAISKPGATRETFEGAGVALLLAGRLDEARAAAEAAAKRGERSEVLDAISKAVVRAQNGPDWPTTFRYASSNYLVVSDMDAENCRAAANVLEDALADFRINVKQLPSETKRLYRVYLFSGEAGFKRYADESRILEGGKGPERVAGLYSTILKQLLIWSLPNRDAMMRTVRHEGFHQYLDRLLPDPPVWFNEGLAVYFEAAVHVGGELRADKPRFDLLEILAKKPLVPLADFLHETPSEFYAAAPHSYAQAWLLVHMLRHGTPKQRELYRTMLSRLETLSGSEATEAVFDEASLPVLDAALEAWRVTQAAKKG